MYIKKDDDTGMWRIVRCVSNEEAVEEIVFMVTGAINTLDLLLVTTDDIRSRAADGPARGELEDWKLSNMQGFMVIELSNRYFRPCMALNEEESVPFSMDIDLEVSYLKGEIDKKDKKKKNATNQPGPAVVRMKRKIGFGDDIDDDKYKGSKRMNEGRNDEDGIAG
ncbi:hypothetical protein IW262DRAFT_1302107 [Armillaria fumosa]|nr:hypothetical protein IW262DRAFT_1302107 [Armillaria fumosa]